MDYKEMVSIFIMGLKKEYQDLSEDEKIVPMELVEKFLDVRKDLKEDEYVELKDEIVETLGDNSDIFGNYSQLGISKEMFGIIIEELEDAGFATQFPL